MYPYGGFGGMPFGGPFPPPPPPAFGNFYGPRPPFSPYGSASYTGFGYQNQYGYGNQSQQRPATRTTTSRSSPAKPPVPKKVEPKPTKEEFTLMHSCGAHIGPFKRDQIGLWFECVGCQEKFQVNDPDLAPEPFNQPPSERAFTTTHSCGALIGPFEPHQVGKNFQCAGCEEEFTLEAPSSSDKKGPVKSSGKDFTATHKCGAHIGPFQPHQVGHKFVCPKCKKEFTLSRPRAGTEILPPPEKKKSVTVSSTRTMPKRNMSAPAFNNYRSNSFYGGYGMQPQFNPYMRPMGSFYGFGRRF